MILGFPQEKKDGEIEHFEGGSTQAKKQILGCAAMMEADRFTVEKSKR